MHPDTHALHAGHTSNTVPGPFMPGPQFSATYITPGDPAEHALLYGRFNNPTWTAWEKALSDLEGGSALAFSSGMAAVTALFATVLRPGDTVVLPADCYYTTRQLIAGWFAEHGITHRLVPTTAVPAPGAFDGAKLVLAETPSNPELAIADIAAWAAEARAAGALLAVDNTTATVALQQPLSLGATFSVASDTKMLTGHADLVLGHVATSSAEWFEKLLLWRKLGGSIPGPMEVWLAHRALGTVGVRLARQCDSAMAVATMLGKRSGVTNVLYPGLATHPGHEAASRQMRRPGCVLSFDVGSKERATTFLGALTLVREATSFGGIHSTAERRARWGGDAVTDGFIRFSCGIEATEDLIADIQQALAAAGV